MRYHCEVLHGRDSRDQKSFRLTLESDSKADALVAAVRSCQGAFPGDVILSHTAREVKQTAPRRRDYVVRVTYRPPQTPQARMVRVSNSESPESAEAFARREFALTDPEARILTVKAEDGR